MDSNSTTTVRGFTRSRVGQRTIAGAATAIVAAGAILAGAGTASADSDQGYVRLQASSSYGVLAGVSLVGKIPEGAIRAYNAAPAAAAASACTAYVGTKLPSSFLVQWTGGLAAGALCGSVADKLIGDAPEVEGDLCFDLPLASWSGARGGWC